MAWQQCADISISHVTAWNNPVKTILQSMLMTFCSLQSHKVIGVRLQARSTVRRLWCNFNDNHWQWAQFPGIILSHSSWSRCNRKICFCSSLSEPRSTLFNQCKRQKKKGEKSPLTASDSVSFQSACIRFITFLSLHLVDASRVRLHWYGRGGLSCDYDIFLGALSSHSISLG